MSDPEVMSLLQEAFPDEKAYSRRDWVRSVPNLRMKFAGDHGAIAYVSGTIEVMAVRRRPSDRGVEVVQMMVVKQLAVAKEVRRNGHAQVILSALHNMGWTEGCDFAILKTDHPALFESSGYRSVDVGEPGVMIRGLFRTTKSWPEGKLEAEPDWWV